MHPKSILVIDDDIGNREALRMILKDSYDIILVDNGRDGLELLKEKEFDLIILDIVLPNMDGIEILRNIRSIDQKIKVIIVTATKGKDVTKEIEMLGVSGWIGKPFDVSEVRRVVQENSPRIPLFQRGKKGDY